LTGLIASGRIEFKRHGKGLVNKLHFKVSWKISWSPVADVIRLAEFQIT